MLNDPKTGREGARDTLRQRMKSLPSNIQLQYFTALLAIIGNSCSLMKLSIKRDVYVTENPPTAATTKLIAATRTP
jgi:hypothetical protein